MEEALEVRLSKGNYWQVTSTTVTPKTSKEVENPQPDCVISFVDTQGKQYLVCHFDHDWVDGFMDVLASLVAHNIFDHLTPSSCGSVGSGKYATTAGWIACQVLKRCPPMQLLFSDQPNAYDALAKRYVTVLIDNETRVLERILQVFEWQGPHRPSCRITMEDLLQRWKRLSVNLATAHATTDRESWLCNHVLRGC